MPIGHPTDPAGGLPDAEEPRAKDCLRSLPLRRVLGEALVARVGRRRWDRAPVTCCSGKIFSHHSLPDPWDPAGVEAPLALGPVGLRFEERRQPAPHARVKEERKPEKQAWTAPKGVSEAPRAKPGAAPSPAPVRKAGPAPDLKAAPAPPRPLPAEPPPRPAGSRRQALEPPRAGAGRFRLQPTATSAPRVRQLPPVQPDPVPEPIPADPEPASKVPPPEPARGLDDLFGVQGGGRDKRVGRTPTKKS